MNEEESLVVIRPCTREDVSVVALIDHALFSPLGTAEEPEIFAKRFSAHPEGFFVAEAQTNEEGGEGKVMVGFATSERWIEERDPTMNEDPLETYHPEGKVLCITGMAVLEEFQRKAVGSRLLEKLICMAKEQNIESIILETSRARRFYEKNGFHFVREKEQWGVTLSVMRFLVDRTPQQFTQRVDE